MEDPGHVRVTEQRIVLGDKALQNLPDRLADTRVGSDLGSGWEKGMPSRWLRDLLEDCRDFATDALQLRSDRQRQLCAEVQGHRLHLVHAQGSRAESAATAAHPRLVRVVSGVNQADPVAV
jgi:hypothetical protein